MGMKGAGGGVCQRWEESQLRLLRYPVLDPDGAAPVIPAPSPAKERDWAGGENETSDLPRPVPELN